MSKNHFHLNSFPLYKKCSSSYVRESFSGFGGAVSTIALDIFYIANKAEFHPCSSTPLLWDHIGDYDLQITY